MTLETAIGLILFIAGYVIFEVNQIAIDRKEKLDHALELDSLWSTNKPAYVIGQWKTEARKPRDKSTLVTDDQLKEIISSAVERSMSEVRTHTSLSYNGWDEDMGADPVPAIEVAARILTDLKNTGRVVPAPKQVHAVEVLKP